MEKLPATLSVQFEQFLKGSKPAFQMLYNGKYISDICQDFVVEVDNRALEPEDDKRLELDLEQKTEHKKRKMTMKGTRFLTIFPLIARTILGESKMLEVMVDKSNIDAGSLSRHPDRHIIHMEQTIPLMLYEMKKRPDCVRNGVIQRDFVEMIRKSAQGLNVWPKATHEQWFDAINQFYDNFDYLQRHPESGVLVCDTETRQVKVEPLR